MSNERIVVIGGGLAAATAVTELREHGFAGSITVLAGEAHAPYERPPLSKEVLLGEAEPESAAVHDLEWYAEHDVDLHLGTLAERIDREAREVHAGGEVFGYDRLLIATGARARSFDLADDSGAPVSYLRTVDDSIALREAFTPGLRLGVIGGGWIGLEAAAAARGSDVEVTVLESLAAPLLRVLGPEVAQVFVDLHKAHGVKIVTDAEISSIKRAGDVVEVRLADGSSHEFDRLVVGVGVLPNAELAEAAGLSVDNGIRTDSRLRTSDPLVFAAGDVANVDHPVLGEPLRVEHWDTSIKHGKVAAANLAGGDVQADALPYFFTDQYDFGMEYVGHAGADDRVLLRGDVQGRVFTAWWLRDDRVVAGMHANDWDAIEQVRRIVGHRVDAAQLGDASVGLDDVALRD